ncbi:MAG TPA: PadR family transcriptional regulator [Candidatus Saccharimonadales bacterium]|nr:PadR family transcriptional regulator [Candidatus Saccharimonadales bacterium]
MADNDDPYANQILELRRGTIVLAILSQLAAPKYGYALLQTLESAGLPVDAGTLYPLLRRLEKQGVLESSWDTSDKRPRKYYRLSQEGTALYERLAEAWRATAETMTVMLHKEN